MKRQRTWMANEPSCSAFDAQHGQRRGISGGVSARHAAGVSGNARLKQEGTRETIELLVLGRQEGWLRLRAAVETALELGSHDTAAVRHLLAAEGLRRAVCEPLPLEALSSYERPLPAVAHYDALLGAGAP